MPLAVRSIPILLALAFGFAIGRIVPVASSLAAVSPSRGDPSGGDRNAARVVRSASAASSKCSVDSLDPVLPVLSVKPCLEGWPPASGARSFVDIVKANGATGLSTDKAPNAYFTRWTPHVYNTLYQRWLAPLRGTNVRFLEIGLGCDMPSGVGASVPLWREYMGPCMKFTSMEFDGPCAEKFRDRVDALFVGDQSSLADLHRVSAGGPYDVIVEDGGHTMKQQITTLRTMLPLLPPGGLFFMEDIHTSFQRGFHDLPNGVTAARFLADVVAALHQRGVETPASLVGKDGLLEGAAEIARLITSIDCVREACVLVRNGEPAADVRSGAS